MKLVSKISPQLMNQKRSLSLPVSRENHILLCAVSVSDEKARTSRINELLNQGLDWQFILKNSEHHEINSMLYWQLSKIPLQHVPLTIAAKLKNDYKFTIGRNMLMLQILVDLIELFRSASIPLLPYKGLALTHALYEDIACRQMGDIDVLVKEIDVDRAKSLLLENGYVPVIHMTPCEIKKLREQDCEEVFYSPKMQVSIELHWRLLPPVTSHAADCEDIWDHIQETWLFGEKTLSLQPEWNTLAVFLHAGIKHRWKEIKLIADAARIIQKYKDMDWNAVLYQAALRNEEIPILLGCYLAHSLLGATLPKIVLPRIKRFPQVRAFAGLAMGRLFREDHGLPGFKEWRRYTRALLQNCACDERPWSPLEEIYRYTTAVLTPEFKDKYQLIGLPKELFFLHFLIRPIRLAQKHGVGLVRRVVSV